MCIIALNNAPLSIHTIDQSLVTNGFFILNKFKGKFETFKTVFFFRYLNLKVQTPWDISLKKNTYILHVSINFNIRLRSTRLFCSSF